jgi:type I restriction enzyme S subunit
MIPHSWKICQLEDLANVERGRFSARPRNDPQYYGGHIPFVQTGDVSGSGRYLRQFSQTLNERGLAVSKLFPAGTILVTIAANIGDTAITPFAVAFPDSVVGIQVFDCADNEWLNYYLQTMKEYLDQRATQNAQKNINLEVLRPLPILTPPLTEQRRIPEILSTWDRAIEATEKLIAGSQAQKKALMQQLLTGKKRLPGFSREWSEQSLGALFEFKKGRGLSKDLVTPNGLYPCILYGELYTRYTEVIRKVVGRTNANDGFPSKSGDVLLPASTTTTGIDLANATALLESDVLLSGDINVLRPKNPKQSAPFFAYLLTHVLKHQIASQAQGITIVHLYAGHLKPLNVYVPDVDEQHEIAHIILEADEEVQRYHKLLSALREEKSALMQQLLTGKRRVTLPTAQERVV